MARSRSSKMPEQEYMLTDFSEPRKHDLQEERQEWIPPWLRMTRTLPLAIYCVIFVAALEALNRAIRRQQGIPTNPEQRYSVAAARYIPTIGVIALGFACKSIASDAKKVTPWSAISYKWSESSHSIALDYSSGIEILSVIPAAKRKHWSVFVGLVVGLICGLLVAVANALTYVDSSASGWEPTTFNKATTFNFNGTLEKPDHSLAIPYTYEGQKPYAAVVAEQLPNGQAAAWTMDSYVFESFTNTTKIPENGTIEAQTKAFFPDWSCHPIGLTLLHSDVEYYGLQYSAKTSEQRDLNCNLDTEILYLKEPGTIFGTLNVTACGADETDLRLLSTLVGPTKAENGTISNNTIVSALCVPSFTMQDTLVRVNQSTGEVLDYTLGLSAPTPIDIKTSIPAMYIYLNNPLDGRSQEVFSANDLDWHSNKKPSANLSVVAVARKLFEEYHALDPFTSSIAENEAALKAKSFLDDPPKFLTAVEQQAKRTMAQIINSLARANTAGSIDGRVWIVGPRLFLQQIWLRTLQASLFAIALCCVLQSVGFRPKTVLREDPGSIAAHAVVLASSTRGVQRTFLREALSSEEHMRHCLTTEFWNLQQSANGAVMLQATRQEQHDSANPLTSYFAGTHRHDGFRPFALGFWAKWVVIFAIFFVMAALAALMTLSHSHNGICPNLGVALNAFTFLSTVTFTVLGYGCSGIDAAVRVMTPYKSLWYGYSGRKNPLLFSFGESATALAPLRAIRKHVGLTIAASSFVVLFVPAIKIVAAGLYEKGDVQRMAKIRPFVDMSFVNNLEDTFGLPPSMRNITARIEASPTPDLEANIQVASQFTEWAMHHDFNIPIQAGILDNLVFSNLTSIGSFDTVAGNASLAEITATVPAIKVEVSCISENLRILAEKSGDCYSFRGYCRTSACNSTFKSMVAGAYAWEYSDGFGFELGCESYYNRYHGDTTILYDLGYQVIISDSGLARNDLTNTSSIRDGLVPVTGDVFNSSALPTLVGAVCYSNFSRVDVSTTFTRKISSSSSLSTSTWNMTGSSWHPIRYDSSTITRTKILPSIPYWLQPLSKYTTWEVPSHYDSSTDLPGLLDSPSLWPTRGSSTSMFELLATYASTHGNGDVQNLMGEQFLKEAAEFVYTSFATNMLTRLRPLAANASGYAQPISIDGTIAFPQERIHQDLSSTIAIEVLLGLMALCFVWVAVRFPNEAVLPKNPGSIAAMATLVAGSRLVERLIVERVTTTAEAGEWIKGQAALGWWPLPGKDFSTDRDDRSDCDGEVTELEELEEAGGSQISGGEELPEAQLGNVNDRDGSDGDTLASMNQEGNNSDQSETVNEDEEGLTEYGVEEAEIGLKFPMRWGIDIGEGVIRKSWRDSPWAD